MKPPTFTRHDDGRLTVDEWTPEIWITEELLRTADPAFIAFDRDRGLVNISVSNGRATYRIVERRTVIDPEPDQVRAVRETWRLDFS